MAKRIGGSRRKTRHSHRKQKKKKGKISLTSYLNKFKKGDKVHLGIDSSVHKGMVYRRFIGKIGEVDSSKGKCYNVKIKDGNKNKMIIVHPVHLRRVK